MFMITLVLIPVSIFAQIITLRLFFFLPPTQEFEIDLEGSQTLRLLCYEKCYNKTKQNKEDGESTDRIMGKGQIPVRHDVIPHHHHHHDSLLIGSYVTTTAAKHEIQIIAQWMTETQHDIKIGWLDSLPSYVTDGSGSFHFIFMPYIYHCIAGFGHSRGFEQLSSNSSATLHIWK